VSIVEAGAVNKAYLQIPTQCEKGDLDTVEYDIKDKPSRVEELALKPRFTHGILSDSVGSWAKIEKWGLPKT
jgi:hypothetical protein